MTPPTHLAVLAAIGLALAAPAASPGAIERVSVSSGGGQADGISHGPSISASGRFVAFTSSATNLVGDDTNGYSDVFVHDRRTGRTTRVSVSSKGRQGNRGSYAPAISGSGRHVAFCSYASNLAGRDRLPRGLHDHELEPYRDVFVHDRRSGRTRMVSRGSRRTLDDPRRTPRAGSCYPAVSHDGGAATYLLERTRRPVSDIDRPRHVMGWSARTGKRRRIDVTPRGRFGNGDSGPPAMSGDGRWIAFTSGAADLVGQDTNGTWDAFLASSTRRHVRRVSVTAAGEQVVGDTLGEVDVSHRGRFVAFLSYAHELHAATGDSFADAYVKDVATGAVDLLSSGESGAEADGAILDLSLSASGRYGTFSTDAANLIAGTNDGWSDVFLRDRTGRRTRQVSAGDPAAPLGSSEGDVARDGTVAFTSHSSANAAGDTNGEADVFVRSP